MSKLESIKTRVQACEAHLGHPSRTSPPPPSSDPKGKAPMVSPTASPTTSPIRSPQFHSPLQTDPVIVPFHSSHSSSSDSSASASQHFEFSARTPPVTPRALTPTPSQDSEATPSDPARFIITPPPSPPAQPPSPAPPPAQPLAHTPPTRTKQGASKHPSYTPSPPSPTQLSQPPPSTHTTPIPYTHRKLAVSRPGTSTPPPPPPPP